MNSNIRNHYRKIKHILDLTNDGTTLPANELALLERAFYGLLTTSSESRLDQLYEKITNDKIPCIN